eukprot:NODE_774_length_3980_cov_0.719402.p1 type:complete len:418 gc:universal NODE_774_length_3980_cov_0.719402:2125-3378(+)
MKFIFQILFLILHASDCQTTLDFFMYLNMHITDPVEFNLIPQNCCDYQSNSIYTPYDTPYHDIVINCTATQVTTIQVINLNINGFINSTSLPKNIKNLIISSNLQLTTLVPNDLPDSLDYLDLGGNSLYGPIPTTLPVNLTQLSFSNNHLTGNIPKMPPNLIKLYLDYNDLSGDIPNDLPSGLQYLLVYYNQFTGSINHLPDTLKQVILDVNLFNGTLDRITRHVYYFSVSYNLLSGEITADLPDKLDFLSLDYNLLTGVFPQSFLQVPSLYINDNPFTGCFDVVVGCTTCYMFRNQFRGPIVFQKPISLAIFGNLITNVTIIDNSTLTDCELDNNPLLNAVGLDQLPSICTKTKLFANTGYICANNQSSIVNSTVKSISQSQTSGIIAESTIKSVTPHEITIVTRSFDSYRSCICC